MKELAAQLRKPAGKTGIEVGGIMSRGNKVINEWSIEALQLVAGDAVLEIGMGNGAFVSSILQVHPSISYRGCDYSSIMVAEAEKVNADAVTQGRACFDVATAGALPYPDRTFSKILTVNTLYFWGDATAELAEIKRVSMPGGNFVIGIRSEKAMNAMPFTSFGFNKYSESMLLELLAANGFLVSRCYCREEAPYLFEGRPITLENIVATCQWNGN